MKTFSKKWIASSQKRKQRKYRFNAPWHIKRKFISASLSKDLRKKYGKRSIPLKKGDIVIIKKGEFKKKKGKISKIDFYNVRAYVEGIQKNRRDGTKVDVPTQPANLQITELNLEDKQRVKILERKKK